MSHDEEVWTRTCIEGLAALVRMQAAFLSQGHQYQVRTPEVAALEMHLANFGAYKTREGRPRSGREES